MGKVEWYYQRKGCKTCAKADAFLAEHRLTVEAQVDCKKHPVERKDVPDLLTRVRQVLAMRGSALKSYSAPFEQEEVLAAVVGPSGNLRAPSLIQDGRLYVGFDEKLYDGLLNP
jgi:arsenate reductase-like glutaredoxin family protein